MKYNNKIHLILFIVITIMLSSCATNLLSYYVQLYEVKSEGKSDSTLIFIDKNISINYDFWGDNGRATCIVYNLSDSFIYLDLEESFFVNNGNVYDYYQGASKEVSSSISYISNTYYNNTKYWEVNNKNTGYSKPRLVLPPKSYRRFLLPEVSSSYIKDCDYEKPDTNYKKEFTASTSPIFFSNIISYQTENSIKNVRNSNSFYVSSIQLIKEIEFWEFENEKECGEVKYPISRVRYSPYHSQNKFYISL